MRGEATRDANGYADIAAYAAIGDGAALALVATDGGVDWLAAPSIADPPVCAALLDPERGGGVELQPDLPFTSERCYLPDTNVLETVFHTADGSVRVTDAITREEDERLAWCELARRVEGLSGRVPVRWRVHPRFGFGARDGALRVRDGVSVITDGDRQVGVFSWGAGEARAAGAAVEGRAVVAEGERALVALASTCGPALPRPSREDVERRLDLTAAAWRRWVAGGRFGGPWRDALVRSALALRLLIAPTGAVAAAGTTSLPEQPAGERNWDYRLCWTRDTAFTLDALIRLGYRSEVHEAFAWQIGAARRTAPRLPVVSTLDGGESEEERELDLAGYRGALPVRSGNAAAGQLQLGTYGDLFETAFLYVREGNALDAETRGELEAAADLVCHIWRRPDSGIWELRGEQRQHTLSKMGCWAALDRALAMAHLGLLDTSGARRWRRERDRIRLAVERDCWSERRAAYTFCAGGDELDAGVLRAVPWGWFRPCPERLAGTVDAVRGELGAGPLLWRCSPLRGEEGAFVACSFWLVVALAELGRVDEAADLLDELVAHANDVGLYAEELDPGTGAMLGNFPQALSHLALVNAADRLREAWVSRRPT
jgi:GH15 family glucan-1,4-alpha-glucosidase